MGRSLRHRNRKLRILLIGLISAAVTVAALEIVTTELRTGSELPSSKPGSGGTLDPAPGPTTTLAPGAASGAARQGAGITGPGAQPRDPAAQSRALKPVLGGLLDRHHVPEERFRGVVKGFVATIPWATLQPEADAPLAARNLIDQAISVARAERLKLKLRVTAGIDAPDWAKRLGG